MTRARISTVLAVGAALAGSAVFPAVRAPFVEAWVRRSIRREERVLSASISGRRIAARIAGAAPHRTFAPVRTGAVAASLTPYGDLALATLEAIAARRPSVGLERYGVARLVAGDAAGAVALLERARPYAVDRAAFLVNMAAAYYARSSPGDRVRALDAALASIRVRDSPAARFDAALAVEHLMPPGASVRYWNDALNAERDPEWRREIIERLRVAGNAANGVQHSNSSAWLKAWSETIPRWVGSCAGEAGDKPARFDDLEARLSDAGRDAYGGALAAWLAAAAADCRPEVVGAVRRFLAARAAYRADDLAGAARLFGDARSALGRVASPLEWEARLYGAVSGYFVTRDAEATLAELREVRHIASQRGFTRIEARAEWMSGYVLQDRAAFQDALDAFERCRALAVRSGDRETAAVVDALIASVYDWLGDYSRGWTTRERALAQLVEVADPRALQTILASATRAALRDGLTAAALVFSDASVDCARAFASDARLAESELDRARIAHQAGDRAVVERALESAARYASSAISPVVAARLRANLEAARAETADGASGVQPLSAAIDGYRSGGADIALARLFLMRARAYIARGDDPAAEDDLASGIDAFERARRQLRDAAWRLSYFEEAWALFDEAIERRLRHGDAEGAFALAERGHSRVLGDALSVNPRFRLQDVQSRLPPGSALIRWTPLERGVAVWTISRSGAATGLQPVSSREVQAAVDDLVACLAQRRGLHICDDRSAVVYRLLLEPIAERLSGISRLVVIPDGFLQKTPFAALWNPSVHRYVVEDFEISYAPSAAALMQPARAMSGQPRALVVAPSVSGAPPLPNAEREARSVAARFSTAATLFGAEATRERFLHDLRGYDVLHFAGHAVTNPDAPELSRLLLRSADGDGPSPVYGYEIARLPLNRVRAAVLAACDTAAGRTLKSEGVLSLARDFMAAGVSTVVATLWPVEDEAAARLFPDIHEGIRRGIPAARSLRTVQLAQPAAVRSADTDWASIVVFDTSILSQKETPCTSTGEDCSKRPSR